MFVVVVGRGRGRKPRFQETKERFYLHLLIFVSRFLFPFPFQHQNKNKSASTHNIHSDDFMPLSCSRYLSCLIVIACLMLSQVASLHTAPPSPKPHMLFYCSLQVNSHSSMAIALTLPFSWTYCAHISRRAIAGEMCTHKSKKAN